MLRGKEGYYQNPELIITHKEKSEVLFGIVRVGTTMQVKRNFKA